MMFPGRNYGSTEAKAYVLGYDMRLMPTAAELDNLKPGSRIKRPHTSISTASTIETQATVASSQVSIVSSSTDISDADFVPGDGSDLLTDVGAQFSSVATANKVIGYEQTLDKRLSADAGDKVSTGCSSKGTPRNASFRSFALRSEQRGSRLQHRKQLPFRPRVPRSCSEDDGSSSDSSENEEEFESAYSPVQDLPEQQPAEASLYASTPPDASPSTAPDTPTTSSAESPPAPQAVFSDVGADEIHVSVVEDAVDQLHIRAQQSWRIVQEAYEEYASYLESVTEWDDDAIVEEESGEVKERNEQESSPTSDNSDSATSGNTTGTSSHEAASHGQGSRSIEQSYKRSQEEAEDSEDEGRPGKRRRPLSSDRYDQDLAKFIICPYETCGGRDGGGIFQWL